MRDQVEEVKSKTDIVSLIGDSVKLTKAGKHFKGLCPFHSEKTPSFTVSPELQIYKCFGCGEAGDVFNFLEKYEGMEFSEALKFLADRAGVELIKNKNFASGEKEILYQINALAAKFYHYLLLNHAVGKESLEYVMKTRGLLRETIETFQVGFAPENQNALVSYLVSKKKYKPEDLQKAGVAVALSGRYVDRFRGRIIFPLIDHRGNSVGLAGRIMPGPKSQKLAKYINSPETLIYHKSSMLYGLNITRSEIKKSKFAVVTEGELDMISSYQCGIRNVVAIKGSALTEEQVRILSRLTSNIILALDSDLAGDSAARRGIAIAQKLGMNIKVAKLGQYKDPDDAARADPEGLKNAIKNSINIWDFLIESIFAKHEAHSGEGKAIISREVIPVLASIEDKIVQSHYATLVGTRLGVSVETVLSQVGSGNAEVPKATTQKPEPRQLSRRELLERDLLYLGFNSKPDLLLQSKVSDLITGHSASRLLQALEEYLLTTDRFDAALYLKSLPDELGRSFSEMMLDAKEEEQTIEQVLHEFEDTYFQLVLLNHKLRLEELTAKMNLQEKNKDKIGLKETKAEYAKLMEQSVFFRSKAYSPAKDLGLGGVVNSN